MKLSCKRESCNPSKVGNITVLNTVDFTCSLLKWPFVQKDVGL